MLWRQNVQMKLCKNKIALMKKKKGKYNRTAYCECVFSDIKQEKQKMLLM